MPHIILESTPDVISTPVEVLRLLVETLSACETVSPNAVKARHRICDSFVIGDGGGDGFIHCEVAILEGRPLELRESMSNQMVNVLRGMFGDQGGLQLTLELREMAAQTYRK
jgi:5-carboxymethyl-2-hydroxymuconate isomerase